VIALQANGFAAVVDYCRAFPPASFQAIEKIDTTAHANAQPKM